MSYARFSDDSDVYVIGSSSGIECCGCRLLKTDAQGYWHEPFPVYQDNAEMLVHLYRHRQAGHKVEGYVFDGVASDLSQFWVDEAENKRLRDFRN